MYKYQCSREDCGCTWTLHEGSLNGFVLTCPICSKGRGLFLSQIKHKNDRQLTEKLEEITITVKSGSISSTEDLNQRIEEFKKKYSLTIVTKNIEQIGGEIICTIQYKLGNPA